MKNLNELFTPCLILDENKFSKNIERLKSIVDQKNINFRPHLKTAKCIEITKRFSETFGNRAMVSTIEEIEKLKICGINDFLYSVAIVPNKFDRIARCLSEDCKISVLVDDISIARELVDFYKQTGLKITALIELDLDGHRSGVKSNSSEQLYQIGKCLDNEGLFRGVMSHAGESYNLSNSKDLRECARNEAEQTLLAVSILKEFSIECELVTIGSTPTTFSDYHNDKINELRAGVFVFFDLVQSGVGICRTEDIAISVLTSVISINKDIDAIIIDAGWMALSRDIGNPCHKVDYGYGQVCDINGKIIEDLIVVNVQQEHGIIKIRKGSKAILPQIKQGDMLRILPNHACATASAYNRYHVINEENKNYEIWDRFNDW